MKSRLLISLLSLPIALASCGPKGFKTSAMAPSAPIKSGFNDRQVTAATNYEGKQYTGFSPQQEFAEVLKQVDSNDKNRDLGQQIQDLQAAVNGGSISISIQWKNLKDRSLFKGNLKEEVGLNRASDLEDTTKQRSEIKVSADCKNQKCTVVSGIISHKNGARAGFIYRFEQRSMTLKILEPQKKKMETLNPETRQVIQKFGQPFSVNVRSMEIIPGQSNYTIFDSKDEKSFLFGELLTTNEGSSSVVAEGDFRKLGSADLIGNNNAGDLIFRFVMAKQGTSNSDEGLRFYLILNDRPSAAQQTPVKDQTQAPPSGGSSSQGSGGPKGSTNDYLSITNPLLKQILGDKDRPEVKSYIQETLAVQKNNKGEAIQTNTFWMIKKYIACHLGDSKNCGRDRANEERQKSVSRVTQLLHEAGLPAALSIIPLLESDYNSSVVSKAGAVGWWQFMLGTAQENGLKVDGTSGVDERTDLDKSTLAAIKYLKSLLAAWNGDLKLAVAAYNFGETRLRKFCGQKADSTNCINGRGKFAFSELRELLEVSNNDFWVFYESNFLPAETQNYVMNILAGNIVAANPRAFNLDYEPVNLN